MTHILETGAILGKRYKIHKLLGHGGMGAVYLAQDTRLDVRCAVKETFYTTSEALAQFEREARLLAKLKHPHLPRVTDYFAEQARYYLVMEYISGADLLAWREQNGPPTEQQAAIWACQLLDALDYLHHRRPPVIHRDVKPANVRLTAEGQAVLVDFGIAKVFDPDGMTTTGAKAISPGYSPPEQYSHAQRTDARSDVYGLGATLYYALVGRCPPEAVERYTGEALPPPSRFRAVNPQLERVILRAMAMDPDERWPNARAMQAALRAALRIAVDRTTLDPAAVESDAGGVRALKLVLPDGREYALRPGETLRLGRAPDNDVVLRAECISRHHAEICTDRRGSMLIDLGSTNKTFLDRRPLTPHRPYSLAAGARVRVGDEVTFTIERGEVRQEAGAQPSPEIRQRELERLDAGRTVVVSSDTPAEPARPRPGAGTRLPGALLALGAVALLTLGAIVAGAVLLLSRGRETSEGTPAPVISATSTVASPGEGTVDEPTVAPEGETGGEHEEMPEDGPTPIPTSTAKPTGGPDATEEATVTPTPVADQDTPTPPPPVTEIVLLAPSNGQGDVRNPVVFRWRGGLAPNQRYQVTAAHADGSASKTSELLTEATWTVHLPAEKHGEWRWFVNVVEGSGANYATRHTSDTWMFWFVPMPGGAPPDEPGPQPTDPPSEPTPDR